MLRENLSLAAVMGPSNSLCCQDRPLTVQCHVLDPAVQCTALYGTAVQCTAMECTASVCSELHCNVVHCSVHQGASYITVRCSSMQYGAVHSVVQCSAVRCSEVECGALQARCCGALLRLSNCTLAQSRKCRPVLYSAVQCSTVQCRYTTVVQCIAVVLQQCRVESVEGSMADHRRPDRSF